MTKIINTIFRICVFTLLVTACARGQFINNQGGQLRSACAQEAELLISPVNSYDEPIESKTGVTILESGRFIYRCEKRAGWMAIMYPRFGEKIDCKYRDNKYQCPIGWIKDELTTSNFD